MLNFVLIHGSWHDAPTGTSNVAIVTGASSGIGLDAAIPDTDGNGDRRLLEIRFSGKKFSLQIEPQSASTTCADPPLLIPECGSVLPW